MRNGTLARTSPGFRKVVLTNGLTVIAEPDPSAHTASVGFFVRTGARDETSTLMGVSHFLEHMMFKGSKTRSADQINHEFDAMGARANAYTSSEMTAFYASVLPEYSHRATNLLADMLRPALSEEDFATEKGVILEEIAMYKDEPSFVLYEAAMERHFASHPLGHRVLGTEETITSLTASQMRAYFEHRYSADTTTLAATGNIDFDALVSQAEQLCGWWGRTGAQRDLLNPPFAASAFDLKDPKLSRGYRLLLAPAPSSSDPRRYAAFMATQILGADDNSRFHWALIEPGLADEAEASYDPRDGVGDFRIMVVAEPGDGLERAWQIAQEQVAKVCDGVTEDEVALVRSRIATGVTLAAERPEGRMHRIGRQWTLDGVYTTLEEELERVNNVTSADVRELLSTFNFEPATVGTLAP